MKRVDELTSIGLKLESLDLPKEFIFRIILEAKESNPVYGLLRLVVDPKSTPEERDEFIHDLQEILDDSEAVHRNQAKIKVEDYEQIIKNTREFKDRLRKAINKQYTIGRAAEITGIPQPSLSRMLSSNSMPRKSTLDKIATKLDLDITQIAFDMTR